MSAEDSIYWDADMQSDDGLMFREKTVRIIDESYGGVIAYVHEVQAERIVAALRAQAELSKLGQSEPMALNEWGYPVFPVGTPIEEVQIRDRGQKMIFRCDTHPDTEWASKDPFVSRWFGGNEICTCEWSHYKLSQPYSPTRNG